MPDWLTTMERRGTDANGNPTVEPFSLQPSPSARKATIDGKEVLVYDELVLRSVGGVQWRLTITDLGVLVTLPV